jgi:hypothetical protein
MQWLSLFPCLPRHLDFRRLQNSSREAHKKQDSIHRAKPLPLESSCRFLPAISFLYIATSLPRFPRPQAHPRAEAARRAIPPGLHVLSLRALLRHPSHVLASTVARAGLPHLGCVSPRGKREKGEDSAKAGQDDGVQDADAVVVGASRAAVRRHRGRRGGAARDGDAADGSRGGVRGARSGNGGRRRGALPRALRRDVRARLRAV